MKRFISLLMATLMIAIIPTTAWAAEPVEAPSNFEEAEIDYMHYAFPSDAVILYQGEDGVIYQSNMEKQDAEGSTRSTEYNNVWIDKGKHTYGTFSVKNPHTLILTTQGTLKVECDDSNASADFIAYAGLDIAYNGTIKASQGDVRFSFRSNADYLTIQYYTNTISNKYGMRLNCWLW